jgi:Ca2+-binding RTX toxin-like protein
MKLSRRTQGGVAAVVVSVAGLLLAVSGGAAPDAGNSCKGIPATTNSMTGTNHHDVIVGTNSSDKIDAMGGNDLVCGKRGDDFILGGDGNDLLLANAGDDDVEAGEGDDKAKGNAGNDGTCFKCGPPQKRGKFFGILGGPGNDIVGGGTGDDLVTGEADDDTNRCAEGFDFSPDTQGQNTYRSCEISPNK